MPSKEGDLMHERLQFVREAAGDPLQHRPARDVRRTRLHHHRITKNVTYVPGHFLLPIIPAVRCCAGTHNERTKPSAMMPNRAALRYVSGGEPMRLIGQWSCSSLRPACSRRRARNAGGTRLRYRSSTTRQDSPSTSWHSPQVANMERSASPESQSCSRIRGAFGASPGTAHSSRVLGSMLSCKRVSAPRPRLHEPGP